MMIFENICTSFVKFENICPCFVKFENICTCFVKFENICTCFLKYFDDHVPQEWVTREHCARQLICRGLNRACCVHLLDPILAFLTSTGYINVGLVSPPPHLRLSTNSQVGWGVFYRYLTATLPYHCLTLHRLSTNSQVDWGVFYPYLTSDFPPTHR